MSDVTHRLSAEGADPLALAGVNDGNLLELARATGVRVSVRGDQLTVAGEQEAVERATRIAAARARQRAAGVPPLSPEMAEHVRALLPSRTRRALRDLVLPTRSRGRVTLTPAARDHDRPELEGAG